MPDTSFPRMLTPAERSRDAQGTPRPDLSGDRPVYDQVHPSHRGPNTVQLIREVVARLIVEAKCRRVLDLPCGSGALTHLLMERNVEVVAADLNPDAFVVPQRRAIHADLNMPLPFDDGEFDGIACVEGIEHIENPHHFSREANRLLRIGGKVFISTPNVLSIQSRLSYLLRGYPDQFHFMVGEDAAQGLAGSIAHINPIGFLELRYTLSRWGFRLDQVQTNRMVNRNSLFYRLLRALLHSRGKRAASVHPLIAEVRRLLLSDEVLFGEGLIVEASKVADCGRGRQ